MTVYDHIIVSVCCQDRGSPAETQQVERTSQTTCQGTVTVLNGNWWDNTLEIREIILVAY